MSEGYLPVVTVITTDDGSSLEPTDEIRVRLPLTLTVAGGGVDGERRLEIGLPTASDTGAGTISAADFAKLQAPGLVGQSALAALQDSATIVAFAPLDATRTVSLDYVPISGGLTANNTNFVTVTLTLVDLGTGGVTVVDAKTTKVTGPVATGSWTPGKVAFSFGPTVIPVGNALAIGWASDGGGTGVAVPSGAYRLL